jgi:tetrahydromethanopterin S-methyltransferase subunit G
MEEIMEESRRSNSRPAHFIESELDAINSARTVDSLSLKDGKLCHMDEKTKLKSTVRRVFAKKNDLAPINKRLEEVKSSLDFDIIRTERAGISYNKSGASLAETKEHSENQEILSRLQSVRTRIDDINSGVLLKGK